MSDIRGLRNPGRNPAWSSDSVVGRPESCSATRLSGGAAAAGRELVLDFREPGKTGCLLGGGQRDKLMEDRAVPGPSGSPAPSSAEADGLKTTWPDPLP